MNEDRVVLGKEKIRENTDEIPVFQEMFGYLKTKDKTIIADAMHCQKIYEREIDKATEEASYYIPNSKDPAKKSIENIGRLKARYWTLTYFLYLSV